ncbi:MAG: Gfo/Idh/MocA family oxidoreductase, partial [bacterium]
CQARMCMNCAEARQMAEAARQSKQVTMLCPPPMGMIGDYWIQHLLASGFIGEPRFIHLRAMDSHLLNPESPFHWRMDRDRSGYNTLTVGIYAEVIHRWFGYASRVSAVTRVFTKERNRPDGDGKSAVLVPEAVFVCAEMESGALATMLWSGVAAFPEPSILEVHGSVGTLRYMLQTDEIFGGHTGDENLQPLPIPANRVRRWTVEEDFIAAIREGKSVSPDFEDGLKYMEFTEAVIRAGEEKRSISLPLIL